MKRPLLFILSFLIIGILLQVYIENIFIIIFGLIIIFVASFYLYKRYKIKYCMILPVFSILGYICMYFNTNISYLESSILNADKIYAEGIITSITTLESGSISVKIKTKNITIEDKNINKSFNITTYLDNDENLNAGQGISLEGTFVLGDKPTNPNQFNEYLYLKSNNIQFKAYIDSYEPEEIQNKFIYHISTLNKKISAIYDKILPAEESAILKAMILGDKTDLSSDTKDLYRNAGIYHILAISGLHIGILAVFLNKIFSKISKKYGSLLVMLILIIYCIFTGFSVSTVRATFMCCVTIFSYILKREYDLLSSVSLCAIVLLLINPYNLFNTGFLYSFVSVFAIGFLGLNITKRYNFKGFKASLVVSFFVSLAIKPITMYYSNNFTTLDFLLNLIIIPFTSIVVCGGFIVTLIGIINISLAEFFVGSIYYIFRFFTFLCKTVDNFSFFNIQAESPSILFIISFYIMLILIAFAIYERELLIKRAKYIPIGIFVFILGLSIQIFSYNNFKITMLDVGQAECIVGKKSKDAFLIDAGGVYNKNAGKNIILPYLKSLGIKDLDFIFISHFDSDHISELFYLIENIDIENIFIPNIDYEDDNETFNQLIALAYEYEINVYKLEQGDKIEFSGISFEILNPSYDTKSMDINNASVVMLMNYYENKVLFTGDIEEKAEKAILDTYDLPDIDILKVAHHGSKTSTTSAFFEKVTPEVTLISCGRNNIYKHPNEETLETIKDTQIFRTDKNGAITINFYKNNYKIKTIES